MNTTNQSYSIVDESHHKWTQAAMDKMLGQKNQDKKQEDQNNLDTGWTLEPENDSEDGAKEEAAEAASDVKPSITSTSESSLPMEPMGFD